MEKIVNFLRNPNVGIGFVLSGGLIFFAIILAGRYLMNIDPRWALIGMPLVFIGCLLEIISIPTPKK